MIRYLLPLAFFIGLVVLFIFGLRNDPRKIPSPLIDKPAPVFNLPTLHAPEITIHLKDLKGKVSLINVWASWCAACRTEHPLLVDAVAKDKNLNLHLYGLNYKDKRADALQWLNQLGNPYIESAFDESGSIGIDYGVYGVPETFILDKDGIIRYKHIGPIDKQQLDTIILPLVKKLEAQQR
ncbi:MAG TPA: DsbE family thiol:disulfide interchange protein [Thiotrichaceae bacterium]|jgi:cytochrome c biogenesis protein CcmG/thiol:disulfide interchange protein DsbE|nr:DsbE family thiol:disulfide interchange protein [Thiotrichaceae bacterium]